MAVSPNAGERHFGDLGHVQAPAMLVRTQPLIDELRAVGTAYGVGAGQIALAWLTQFYGDTVVAIPGASKPRQAEENAAVLKLQLTNNELERIDEASRRSGTR
jgi:aryl-alcohol dehydrogenase-like predicted oxidoreductase